MAAAGFQLGRSLFDGILPGTPQQFTRDSHFGRIRSVENQKCLETQFGLNYPVTSECLEIDPVSIFLTKKEVAYTKSNP
jgi:hypothetical protein